MALRKPATASSFETNPFPERTPLTPSLAFDDQSQTRFATAQGSDNEFLQVDLQEVFTIHSVDIFWERARAADYRVEVSQNGTAFTTVASTTGASGPGDDEIHFSPVPARFVRLSMTKRATQWGYSIYEFRVTGRKESSNLAAGAIASSSSIKAHPFPERTPLVPSGAVDGRLETRWGSQLPPAAEEWISFDLGKTRTLDHFKITWEAAYAVGYHLDVSNDGINWETAITLSAGDGGIDEFFFPLKSGRFDRVVMTEKGTQWGYSIKEVELFGAAALN